MRILVCGFALLALAASAIAGGALVDNNPVGGHRAYWPAPGEYVGGTMWTIDGDPMDIWSQALGKTYPKGKYKVYILAGSRNGSPAETRIDIGMGTVVVPAKWKTSQAPEWVGPFDITSARPFNAVQFRCDGPTAIDAFWITDASDKAMPQGRANVNQPLAVDGWKCVWLDFPDSHLRPAWFTQSDTVRIRLRSNSGRSGELALVKCTVLDYDHKPVASQEWNIGLTGSPREQMLNVNVPKRFGPYLLRFSVESGDLRQEYQYVVARVQAPLAFVGDERIAGHFYMSQQSETLAAYIGARSSRLWDAARNTTWRSVEPEQGVWKWDDRLGSFPLGKVSLLGVLEDQPGWSKENSFENPTQWLQYVTQTTSHFRGRIDSWEIFNERYYQRVPDEAFASLVRKTITAIRSVNPSAKMGGPCGPPEEVPGSLDFWRGVGKLGLFKDYDFITGHFYVGGGGTYPIDQDVALDGMLGRVREICDQYGAADKPLWDSEAGIGPNESFFAGRKTPYGIWTPTGMQERDPVPYKVGAAMMARLALTHLWHDCRWYYYYSGGGYGNGWAMCDFPDMTPLPLAVSYAQTNRMMKGAAAAGRVKLEGGIFGFRYDVKGSHTAALWSVGLKAGETRTANWPQGKVVVRDMFANTIPRADTLTIGISPIYLTGSKAQVESALASIKVISKVDPQAGPQPISLDLTGMDRVPNAAVTADISASGSSPENVRDGVGGAAWTSEAGAGEHWVEYRWAEPVEVNRVLCEWPADKLPDGYKIEWWDGLAWKPCSPFYDGFRKPGVAVENYLLSTAAKTDRLRMLIRCDSAKPAAVTEFRAFHIPQLTPPLTEMQELYNRKFQPDAEGFIRDWLVVGPFPSPGNRYDGSGARKVVGWETDFLVDDWINGPNHPETRIEPTVGMKHAVRFPAEAGAPWKPMEVYVAWQPVHAASNLVDLTGPLMNDIITPAGKVVEQSFAYAFCNIVSRKDIDARLLIGSDDGYKIWIDGALAAEKQAFRSPVPDQESYPIKLTRGAHRILLKIHNDIGGHGFYLRFTDASTGKPVTDMDVFLRNADK